MSGNEAAVEVDAATQEKIDAILVSGNLADIDALLTGFESPDVSDEQVLAAVVEKSLSGDNNLLVDDDPGKAAPAAAREEPAPAAVAAATPAPAAATPAPAPATQAPAAAEQPTPVITAKDGVHQIPYSVLENERKKGAEFASLAESQKAEIETLQRQTALLQEQLKGAGIDPKDLPENVRFTAEQIQQAEEWGDLGGTVAVLMQQNTLLMDQVAAIAKGGATTAAAEPDTAAPDNDSLVASNPDCVRWGSNDLHWNTLLAMEAAVRFDPKYSDKPLTETLPEIVRRTKVALGEAVEVPSGKDINAAAEAALAGAVRVAPNSLTDVGGAVRGTEKTTAEILSEGDETDAQAYLERQIALGKTADEVLTALLG